MKKTESIELAVVKNDLEQVGLNLCARITAESLADSMPDLELPARFSQVLLIGSTGNGLWQQMPQHYFSKSDPVDEYSVNCVERILGRYLPADSWEILFPMVAVDSPVGMKVSLQEFGALAGWHHASPLGIGINAEHGLWFAYRALVAIEGDVTVALRPAELAPESPCLTCATTACISTCPAEALSIGGNPDLDSCVSHRLASGSGCASTCVARLACPVGVDFKYADQQIAYFYDRSLLSAQRWVEAH